MAKRMDFKTYQFQVVWLEFLLAFIFANDAITAKYVWQAIVMGVVALIMLGYCISDYRKLPDKVSAE